jgi:hypothetical protein
VIPLAEGSGDDLILSYACRRQVPAIDPEKFAHGELRISQHGKETVRHAHTANFETMNY